MTASADVHGDGGPAASTAVRLRPLRPDDEPAFAAAHRVMASADDFTFGLGYEPGMPWSEYLRARADATEILRQSLVVARAVGVEQVLVTCDDGNVGSAAVIEACGGQLDSVIRTAPGTPPTRRYWIV